jgi:hypothetical protein
MIRNGEISTYPKLLFIKHRLNIERSISQGLSKIRRAARVKLSTDTKSELLKRSLEETDEDDLNQVRLDFSLDSEGTQGLQYQAGFGSEDETKEDDDLLISESVSEDEIDEIDESDEERTVKHRERSQSWW